MQVPCFPTGHTACRTEERTRRAERCRSRHEETETVPQHPVTYHHNLYFRVLPLLAAICVLLAPWVACADPALSMQKREAAVARRLHDIAGDRARVRLFLQPMPKGGELHIHSWGTAFAETDIDWAQDRNYCVTRRGAPRFVPPPCGRHHALPVARMDDARRTALIAALSEDAVNGPVLPRHDHFFATFYVAGPVASRSLIDELTLLRTMQARQNSSYVEFMSSPASVDAMGERASSMHLDPARLDIMHDRLAPSLPTMLDTAHQEIDAWMAGADQRQACTAPLRETAGPCGVTVRFLATVTRTGTPARVFGEMLAAFALAHADPRVVGVNILAPEDNVTAVRDYALHMAMFRYLSARYPDVRFSLHAGELTRAVAPPTALASHIAQAVEAGASRIGHGVDIAMEDQARATLTRMAQRPVAIEVNLTSNDVILGVHGRAHPLHLYLAAGVPVVLSTDDPGVLRTDLTEEYVSAVVDQHLDYQQIRQIVRNALEFSFLPGESLWRDHTPGMPVSACARTDAPQPSLICAGLLHRSEKAALQWRLEHDIARFETQALAHPF